MSIFFLVLVVQLIRPKEMRGRKSLLIFLKDLYKNIYSYVLFGHKKLENEGMPFNWGMAEQIVVSDGDGILLC